MLRRSIMGRFAGKTSRHSGFTEFETGSPDLSTNLGPGGSITPVGGGGLIHTASFFDNDGFAPAAYIDLDGVGLQTGVGYNFYLRYEGSVGVQWKLSNSAVHSGTGWSDLPDGSSFSLASNTGFSDSIVISDAITVGVAGTYGFELIGSSITYDSTKRYFWLQATPELSNITFDSLYIRSV